MSRASASASPGPSTLAFLLQYNQHDVPKPFKRVPTYSNSSSGRKRNFKQIIAQEQEAAFELGGISTSGGSGSGGGGGVKRKKASKNVNGLAIGGGGVGGANGGKKEAGVLTADGKMLQGAAAKQARRREDRLKREAEQAAREEAGEDATSTPQGTAGEGEGSAVAESEGEVAVPLTEEELEQQRLEEEERKRKRSLPTYLSVEAPPSLRPAKKYCDVTGLIAPYTDPKTSLRYHSAEIYEVIKTFGPGIDQAYLSLRGRGATLM